MSRQRGQAIIGVLVLMTLIFLLTGAVAIGTSTLLTRLRGPAIAVDDDLAVRSAAAAAAGVALDPSGCGAGPGGSRNQAVVTLPASGGTRPAPVHAACVAVDHALNQVSRMDVTIDTPGVCTTTAINSSQVSGRTDWWILLAARFPHGGLAYVAPGDGTCQTSVGRLPKDKVCSAQVLPPAGNVSPVVALALRCTVQASSSLALFVFGAQTGFPAYLVAHDSAGTGTSGSTGGTGGTSGTGTTGSTGTLGGTDSYYLAVAGTGLAHPDFEQVLLFRPASSSSVPNPSPELRFEGAQP